MQKLIISLLSIVCWCMPTEATMHHHKVQPTFRFTKSYEWEEKDVDHFNELLISWNAARPTKGHFSIYVRVKTNKWSPWILYSKWGESGQKSFEYKAKDAPISVYQDTLEIKQGRKASGFAIRVIAKNGANFHQFTKLHVCSSDLGKIELQDVDKKFSSVNLDIQGLSQMALDDTRKDRLCSPTSTTAVVRYLNKQNDLLPIDFAEKSYDTGFDIFGNWVLNVAQAYEALEDKNLSCWVQRQTSFANVIDLLEQGYPVVISIRGPLPKGALPYKSGHLLVIKGFNSETQEILCMDPAFTSDEETLVSYNMQDLISAWKRRGYISYVFQK